ncbi:urease accessory UreF family protein [Pelagibius sp. 7325]|uniref:urease accessory protein UreF n=1 Tax=Pelagibius sp. 7325 TaxID=3131994 RepID=UPI0030EF2610
MTGDALTLLRLLQLSDSNFPSGGFAFSNGLETLANEEALRDAADIESYLRDQLAARWATFDRWFLAAAHAAGDDIGALGELDWLCEAQSSVASLAAASRRMGRAMLSSHQRIGTPFAVSYLTALREGAVPGHLPVVQGLIADALELPRASAEASALYQLVSAGLTAAVRLGRLGALEAQSVYTALAPRLAEILLAAPPAEPHAFTPLGDIAAMRHADHATRLFAA